MRGADHFPKTGPLMEYRCRAAVPTALEGSVLVPVTADSMLETSTVKYQAPAGKQKPEQFEGEPPDVLAANLDEEALEQLGETFTSTQTSEEKVEINAVF